MKFKRYNKYYVLKIGDIDKYLNSPEKVVLVNIADKISEGRHGDGKQDKSYVVVNQEMPYAKKVWQLIEKQWLKDHNSSTNTGGDKCKDQ